MPIKVTSVIGSGYDCTLKTVHVGMWEYNHIRLPHWRIHQGGLLTWWPVWPDMVVMSSPGINRWASDYKTDKPIKIEAVRNTVETLGECVLWLFAWLYGMQIHSTSLRSEEHRFAGEQRSVVADESWGQGTAFCNIPPINYGVQK